MKTLRSEVHNETNLGSYEFCKEFRVFNNTERGIYLYGREGYVARIEPTYNPRLASGIYFNTDVKVAGPVKTDADSILNEIDFSNGFSGRVPRYTELVGYTRVRKEMLENLSGFYYIADHDIVLTYDEPQEGIVHPFSHGGIVDHVTNGERKRAANGALDLTIDIVDNEGTFGDRYLNVSGAVLAVKARKDLSLGSGVYAGWTNEIRINGEPMTLGRRLFTFNELETSKDFPFILFKSPEDAKGFDPGKQLELTLTEARNKLDMLKAEREKISLKRKDFYEQRSLSRKDSSDGWKMLPAFILGVATLVKIIF